MEHSSAAGTHLWEQNVAANEKGSPKILNITVSYANKNGWCIAEGQLQQSFTLAITPLNVIFMP